MDGTLLANNGLKNACVAWWSAGLHGRGKGVENLIGDEAVETKPEPTFKSYFFTEYPFCKRSKGSLSKFNDPGACMVSIMFEIAHNKTAYRPKFYTVTQVLKERLFLYKLSL